MNQEELQKIIEDHALWLSGNGGKKADFRGMYLRDARLNGVNLSLANLEDADLTEANLEGVDLSSANLAEANLSKANLKKANLISANLARADMSRANMSDANLRNSDLFDTNLSLACLSGSDLRYAEIGTANLTNTNFRGTNIIISGYDMRGYLFYAYPNDDNVIIIRAGCRTFLGMNEARNHWRLRHSESLRFDITTLLDRIEKIAVFRGVKLEKE